MWKIRKYSLQSGLELTTTRMLDEVSTNWTTDAEYRDKIYPLSLILFNNMIIFTRSSSWGTERYG